MDMHKLILGLALNTRNCIDFLKVHKDFKISRELHGQKKNLIRVLLANYPLLECKRVLQFSPKMNPKKGHCLIKFTFNVIGTIISFHLPLESAAFSFDIQLTTRKIRIINDVIPPESESSFTDTDQIKYVIHLLAGLGHVNSIYFANEDHKSRYLKRLEYWITDQSPLKLAL